MAYRIRYGTDKFRQHSHWRVIRIQTAASALLLLVTGFVQLWPDGERLLAGILGTNAETVTEQAVRALAQTLAEGEGWYRGLAVWCRVILDGAAV